LSIWLSLVGVGVVEQARLLVLVLVVVQEDLEQVQGFP
jgi:hypothetical protein